MTFAALQDRLDAFLHPPPVVAVVPLCGVIGRGGGARAGLSLASLAGVIERAFGLRGLVAVALAVNSPGGSPVQSSLIAGRIRQLADEKHVPVLAFAEDVAASGGYWLALAADEIHADENSIIGSIGVVSAGFGFQDFLARHGVERRVHTQGARKAMLDPFRPEQPEDVARLAALQADMHASFKALVRARRGSRLRAGDEELFNGDIWTGRRALELGLIDGVGDARSVLRARFGETVRLRAVGGGSWWRRRLGLGLAAAPPAMADPEAWLAAIDARASWGRFGL